MILTEQVGVLSTLRQSRHPGDAGHTLVFQGSQDDRPRVQSVMCIRVAEDKYLRLFGVEDKHLGASDSHLISSLVMAS